MTSLYPNPTPGASLLLAFRTPGSTRQQTFLVIGCGTLAAIRAFSALESGYKVVVSSERALDEACEEVRWRVDCGQIQWRALSEEALDDDDVSLVCVTDTLLLDEEAPRRSKASAEAIVRKCREKRVPVNVTDMPALCDFVFPATHRWGESALQMAVTTNGKACRLAGRIRREMVSALPRDASKAVDAVGRVRGGVEEESGVVVPINLPVEQDDSRAGKDPAEAQKTRMRWVSQISEYWPYDRLASLGSDGLKEAFEAWNTNGGDGVEVPKARKACPRRRPSTPHQNGLSTASSVPEVGPDGPSNANLGLQPLAQDHQISLASSPSSGNTTSRHGITLPTPPGRILLVGSGPGHPSLLTVAARKALTELGTLILSDKLVPAQVLALIPKNKTLYIAKKFPGNADGAQNELMEMALEGAKKGEVVVRLKQGDPFLYGRGGEEVLYFRRHGVEPIVIPGVSSALAGPLMAGIPVTQRGVSESLMICTGVGRKGREVELPGYERQKSLAILMGVARLGQIVAALTSTDPSESRRRGPPYPRYTPIAIIERASCADQRVVLSTLGQVEEAMERGGEQRPPGMMFVGWAALALAGPEGELGVLDDVGAVDGEESLSVRDRARVERWLGGSKWVVRDCGLEDYWNQF